MKSNCSGIIKIIRWRRRNNKDYKKDMIKISCRRSDKKKKKKKKKRLKEIWKMANGNQRNFFSLHHNQLGLCYKLGGGVRMPYEG